MPNRNVNLTPDLDDFVLTRVESGRYANASEMVQAALRALDREERSSALKSTAALADTNSEVKEGEFDALAEVDVYRKLWYAHPQSSLQVTPPAEPPAYAD
jgi:antitoxin ParD1/3/4